MFFCVCVCVGFWPGFWDSGVHSCSAVQNKFLNSLHSEALLTRTPDRQGHRALPGQDSALLAATRFCSAAPHKEQSGSSEALAFFNPLFLQTHQQRAGKAAADARDDSFKPNSQLQGATSSSRATPPPRPPPPRRQPAGQKRTLVNATRSGRGSAPRSKLAGTMGLKNSAPKKRNGPPVLQKQPDIDHHRCTFALDDKNIARALARTSLACGAAPKCRNDVIKLFDGREESGQVLSDVSTSSSDSLDSLPHHHRSDPSFGVDRGLSTDYSSDEEKEEEEEDSYGAGLHRNLQLRLQASRNSKKLLGMGPVGARSGSLLILPRALKGHLHKVRGLLGVLATPERRALQRIIELSRDKSSYFGCLVQDYVSFVQENYSCHMSGLDLLQTIRQFMTQMKAYLTQGSELNPPIESLIPEDQIGKYMDSLFYCAFVFKVLRFFGGLSSLQLFLHLETINPGVFEHRHGVPTNTNSNLTL